MNRSKLSLALLAVLVAALAYWLWKSRGGDDLASATPQAVLNADAPRVAPELALPAARIDEPRRDALNVKDAQASATATPRAGLRDIAVRGHVLALGSKRPIEGAEIVLRERDGEPFASTTSNELGAYEILLAGGAPRQFGLLATHTDFSPTWLDTLPGDTGDIELDVELDTHFFIGVDVRSPDGRTTIAGAEMQLWNASPAFSWELLDGLSDAYGHFEFEVRELPREHLNLIVVAEECGPWLMHDFKLEPGIQRRNVICNLEAPRSVRGRVIDARSKLPIPDAELEIVSDRQGFTDAGGAATSDSFGMFEIALEDCPAQFAAVYAHAERYRAARVDSVEAYAHANSAELVIELDAPAQLRGKLVASDGLPLSDAWVEVAPHGAPSGAIDTANVGIDGAFELQLELVPTGATARMRCLAQGCVSKVVDILPVGNATSAPLQIVLDRAVLIRGRVTRSSDGEAIPGVRVRLLDGSETSLVTDTNSLGEYEFAGGRRTQRGAYVCVELGGQRLKAVELAITGDANEILRDISVDFAARAMGR